MARRSSRSGRADQGQRKAGLPQAAVVVRALRLHRATTIAAAAAAHKCLPAPQSSAVASSAQRRAPQRSEEHTSELQSRLHLVCRLLLEKKKRQQEKK